MIGRDQYGTIYKIQGKHPRKELLEQLNSTHAAKMYRDVKDASGRFHVHHIGYVIRGCWITLYQPWYKEVS